ncbi:MAG TPA: hypothetical protein VK921_08515 [Anditalea sp.]|nr:hypothetical protein [Anditalea sp.]
MSTLFTLSFRKTLVSIGIATLVMNGCVETVPGSQEVSLSTTIVPTTYIPSLLHPLGDELEESSGLAYFGEKVWTVNDSGNENIVYQINLQTGKAEKKVKVINAENIDWESLAQSETHLFIGDFGNNAGNRTDLVVLKILKEDLLSKTEVTAEKIFFSYPEQANFEERMNGHNYDCEAFFYSNGVLHLFTKNWENNQTDYYILEPNPGTVEANHQSSFDSDGLITGADINTSTGDIVLIGYENKGIFSQSFIWLLSGYPPHDPFGGINSKIMLGSPADLGQTEAVFIKKDNSGYITSEAIKAGETHITGKIFSFDFNGFF